MAELVRNQYQPDTVSPPGDTLLDTLEMHGLTQAELAARTGRPRQAINEIVKGKKEITAETALQLEKVLGVPANFWLAREQRYREFLARQAEAEKLHDHTDLLDRFPVAELVKRGWMAARASAAEKLDELLRYFGAAGPEELKTLCLHTQAAFRQSKAFNANNGALNAWLRKGEIIGQQTETQPYDKSKFMEALQVARGLTCKQPEEFMEPLKQACADAGVVLAFVPEFRGLHTSGATRWLRPDKALLQLSLRFRWADQIWFSFFHEAGHIVLHGKKDVFLEDGIKSAQEDEANQFAGDLLIPPDKWARYVESRQFSGAGVARFADSIGVHACIVVGRLQHDQFLHFSRLNHLRPQFKWKQSG